MTNEQLLEQLKDKLERGELHPEAIRRLLPPDLELTAKEEPENEEDENNKEDEPRFSFSVTRLLYIVGSLFVILGILYLASQLWDELTTINRILVTLGLGLVFAAFGSVFMMNAPERELGNVFHVIGGFLIPGGALVTLDELVTGISSTWPVTMTVALVFVFYLLLVLYHHRVVLNFFAFANGTALAYLLTNSIIPTAGGVIYSYLTMVIGMSYVIYAYTFQQGWNDRLIPLLYFFGPLGFYGAAFSRVFDTRLMETFFPFLAFGGLVLAVSILKSRIVLLLSTVAVISYIIYITTEYFADSIGWPIALIFLGFLIIGIGYVSISLNRRYIQT